MVGSGEQRCARRRDDEGITMAAQDGSRERDECTRVEWTGRLATAERRDGVDVEGKEVSIAVSDS